MTSSPRSRIAACVAAAAFLGCGATPPPAEPTPVGSDASDPSSDARPRAEEPRAATAEAAGTRGEASRDPVLAATSLPAGLETFSDTERAELEKACKPLMDAIVKAASRDRERADRTEAALHALQSPPNVANVDLARCTSFVRDQLVAYRAKGIEAEAIINIKRIVVGLADATRSEPRLCPSAPAVPANLDAVRSGPHQEPPSGWSADGWTCVRFQLGGAPQRFQYELVTDPKALTYRIIARGFPVDGHGPEELFLEGKMVDGRVTPSSEIMRK